MKDNTFDQSEDVAMPLDDTSSLPQPINSARTLERQIDRINRLGSGNLLNSEERGAWKSAIRTLESNLHHILKNNEDYKVERKRITDTKTDSVQDEISKGFKLYDLLVDMISSSDLVEPEKVIAEDDGPA